MVSAAPLPAQAFVRDRKDFVPAYLRLWREDRSKVYDKVRRALDELRACRVCPRNCDVNRLENKTAVCRTGRHAWVGSAFPHFGEEDCLRGRNGSGTIFFSFCNLKCVFCQNFDISWEGQDSKTHPPHELARMMLLLQARGCHNINFVTPEHVVPQIVEALPHAIEGGLRVPLVYNTSAYDSAASLELMEGLVDVYMPDFKFWDGPTSKRLMAAEDYPAVARERIREMHRQVGELVFDEDGLALRGVLVRHLVMPGGLAGTRDVMAFLAREVSVHTYVNVMSQYHPAGRVLRKPELYADVNRRVTPREVGEAVALAREAGLYRLDARA
jgi:putative pyruvate formate lyase activating enzyme